MWTPFHSSTLVVLTFNFRYINYLKLRFNWGFQHMLHMLAKNKEKNLSMKLFPASETFNLPFLRAFKLL